jgi:hypothetical protein
VDWFAKAFIRASLLWFIAGITLGLAMAIHPAWVVYRPAHAHMNLVGLGAYGFVYNMWRTFDAAERRRRLNDAKPDARKLPLG